MCGIFSKISYRNHENIGVMFHENFFSWNDEIICACRLSVLIVYIRSQTLILFPFIFLCQLINFLVQKWGEGNFI